MYNDTLTQIENAPLPPVRRHGLRAQGRKAWASEVRHLLKELKITGISVTAPNYSMASSITIRLPQDTTEEHEPEHTRLEAEERAKAGPYRGMVQVCPFCKRERRAKDKLEAILQSDSFNFCFTIE